MNSKLNHAHISLCIIFAGVAECSRLEELSLSRNCLQTFTGLHHCTSLTKLDLSYNSINTLSDISGLVSLRVGFNLMLISSKIMSKISYWVFYFNFGSILIVFGYQVRISNTKICTDCDYVTLVVKRHFDGWQHSR